MVFAFFFFFEKLDWGGLFLGDLDWGDEMEMCVYRHLGLDGDPHTLYVSSVLQFEVAQGHPKLLKRQCFPLNNFERKSI